MPLLLRSHFSRGLLLLALVIVLPARAQVSFTIIDLGTFGGTGSVANAINASGQIVGNYTDSGGVVHAFRYSSGSVVDLGPFGGTYATAYALNGSGYFVGESHPASGSGSRAFSYNTEDGMVDLGTLNNDGSHSLATGINSAGTIVGKSNGGGSNHRAFSYTSGGSLVDLGTLGGNHSAANAINDAGVIVGSANTEDSATRAFSYTTAGGMINLGSLGGGDAAALALSSDGRLISGYSSVAGDAEKHAFLYTTEGGMVDLGTLPGGTEAFAKGVNNSGEAVGVSYLSDYSEHAFYYDNGTLYDLNDLLRNRGGWTLVSANGINDAGQIVGYGVINGENHAFLLTAIPEPSTYALLAGLACLAVALGRRHAANR